MKINRKYSLLILIIGISFLATLVFFYVLYNKTSNFTDISQKQPTYKLDAETIISMVNNKSEVSIKTNEVVEIEGQIKEINTINNRITILLGDNNNNTSACVICDMLPNQKDEILKLNLMDTIKLKGVYKGYLADAIFLNCIISKSDL